MTTNNLKESQTLRGIFYPRKITYVLSSLKIAAGCGLVLLGALALYQKASYAKTASGLWAGIIVIISGVFGAFSVKMSASRAYVWAFFASCSMSIISTVLVIIYSATGLARDSGFPGGFIRNEENELVPVTEINFPRQEVAMFINLGLILLGVLDILFTLPCCIICLRELCDCYNGMSGGSSLGLLDGHAHTGGGVNYPGEEQSEWLMSWMGQAPYHHHNNIYFSQASGMPLPHHSPYKLPAPPPYPTLMAAPPHQNTPPFVMIHPSDPSHSSGHSPGIRSSRRSRTQSGRGDRGGGVVHPDSSGSEKRNRSKSPRHSSAEGRPRGPRHQQQVLVPAGHYAPMELYYPYGAGPYHVPPPVASYPSPGSQWGYPWPGYEYEAAYYTNHHPAAAQQQYYDYQNYMAMYGHHSHRGRRSTSSRASKRPRSKSGNRSEGGGGGPGAPNMTAPVHGVDPRSQHSRPKKKSKKGPTDSDIEKTYTGLDRELAEEFIEQTMDPGIIVERTLQSGTESEAW